MKMPEEIQEQYEYICERLVKAAGGRVDTQDALSKMEFLYNTILGLRESLSIAYQEQKQKLHVDSAECWCNPTVEDSVIIHHKPH